jgi:hypothetical protein
MLWHVHSTPELWRQKKVPFLRNSSLITVPREKYHATALTDKHKRVENCWRLCSVCGPCRGYMPGPEPVEVGSNTSTVAMRVVAGDEMETQYLGYDWANLSLGDINAETWLSRSGESRISDSRVWSSVPRDSGTWLRLRGPPAILDDRPSLSSTNTQLTVTKKHLWHQMRVWQDCTPIVTYI